MVQYIPALDCSPRFAAAEPRRTPAASTPLRRAGDRQFIAMESAYASHGGLATGDAVANLMRGRSSQPISALARWIVDRRIVSFRWQSRLLVPLFQFEPAGMKPRQHVLSAVAELSPVLDDWDLALWFVQPNAALDDRPPIDVIDADPAEVERAAQAHRHPGPTSPRPSPGRTC